MLIQGLTMQTNPDLLARTHPGWVTLEGTVERWSQREDTERAVRNLAGVKIVVNKIAVTPAKPVTEDVRKAIEQALDRRAEREARRIRVDVRDGAVTLTGLVHSWAERQSVLSSSTRCPTNRYPSAPMMRPVAAA